MCLEIQELNYEEISETEAISFLDLFSTVGGTLGLWAGVSILTVGEFAELVMRLLR